MNLKTEVYFNSKNLHDKNNGTISMFIEYPKIGLFARLWFAFLFVIGRKVNIATVSTIVLGMSEQEQLIKSLKEAKTIKSRQARAKQKKIARELKKQKQQLNQEETQLNEAK